MKKLYIFVLLFCTVLATYAKHDVAYICQGDTYSWNLSSYCTPDDTLIYASGPTDWNEFWQNAQYDTVIGNTIFLSPMVDRVYKLISINGIDATIDICPIYLTIYVRYAPTVSIDSINHVTCPDGWDFPYADGSFYISLDDSVQNYTWIDVVNDSVPYGAQIYNASTLTGLRSGIYHIFSHGINGCIYHDSVIIEQPDPWVWIEDSLYIDTVCFGQTGCMSIATYGGTPPYNFTWCYFEYTENGLDTIFLEDTTRMVCGLSGGGLLYHVFMYDSRGCKAWGEEMFSIITNLYEYVEDSTHLIITNPIACYGSPFLVQAQSMGYGDYVWHVGDSIDTINYWTWVAADSVVIADYYTPPMTEPTFVSVDFYDQHGCVTHDSIWVEVSHPVVDLSGTPNHLCSNGDYPLDVSAYTSTNPSGGVLYYYGPGMTWNGMFAPSSAGEYEIHSIYTDLNGCLAYDSVIVNVANPEPIILEVDTMMFTDSLYYILAPSGGAMLLGETVLTETNEGYLVDASQYEPGYYTLHYEVVMGEYNCLSEFETVIHFIHRTNVREFNYEISIYPNPAATALNLSSTEEMDFTVSITDIAGKTIRKERVLSIQHSLDVSGLSPGIYLLRMQTPSGANKSVKFVKR